MITQDMRKTDLRLRAQIIHVGILRAAGEEFSLQISASKPDYLLHDTCWVSP